MGSGLTLWFSMFHAELLCKKSIIQHLEFVVNCFLVATDNFEMSTYRLSSDYSASELRGNEWYHLRDSNSQPPDS